MNTEKTQKISGFKFSYQLDEQNILKYTASNLTFCHKLFQVFLDTIPESLDALDKSVDEENFEMIHANAHKIKSNFKIVGLENITNQLAEIEKKSTEKSTQSFEIYRSLKTELTDAMTLLGNETERLSAYLGSQELNSH